MIKVENLSYAFPDKELYHEVSFTIEDLQHAVLIGSNGTGKTTLVDMITDTEKYLYDGKIIKDLQGNIGFVSQGDFRSTSLTEEEIPTVYEFLSEDFVRMQKEMEQICEEMGTSEHIEELLMKYQELLDSFTAIDGDNHESNIKKQLAISGLSSLENVKISVISGGEYKLIQVIRQMLLKPSLLIMDEPDVFLDFENLTGLSKLINNYKGTMLVITHNRYLLNHCFNKILHLEDTDIQEFEGNFVEYNFSLLAKKIELQEQVAKEQAEIERNQKLVNKLRNEASRIDNVSKGKSLKARVSYLARLEARRIKAPFVALRQPKIMLPIVETDIKILEEQDDIQNNVALSADEKQLESNLKRKQVVPIQNQEDNKLQKIYKSEPNTKDNCLKQDNSQQIRNITSKNDRMNSEENKNAVPFENNMETNSDFPQIPDLPQEKKVVLCVSGYSVVFDETLLENVAFEIKEGEKVAIVGPNGTGKTTLLRDIYKNNSGFISFAEGVKTAFLSQNHGEMLNETNTIYEEFESIANNRVACVQEQVEKANSESSFYSLSSETMNVSKDVASVNANTSFDKKSKKYKKTLETMENNKNTADFNKVNCNCTKTFETRAEVAEYLKDYYFEEDALDKKIEILSGGEKNLLQLAKISTTDANFLLLDEPTSHLDTYSQIALEKAIQDYKGTVLMVSHDFYSIANIADYVLFVENKSVRRMRIRSFRKMIYENHFNKDYLELEQKKKELESRIENLLKENEFLKAKLICEELEQIVEKM